MSLLRMPKFQRIGSSWESIVDFFSGRNRRPAKGGRNRRLTVDPLEERMLLTLSVGNLNDQLVNQTPIELVSSVPGSSTPIPIDLSTYVQLGMQSTSAGKWIAVDHNGDFVVVWTRVDPVLYNSATMAPMNNPLTGLPYKNNDMIYNPSTASYMSDSNIYARYYTDEVQRITLPTGLFNNGSQPAKFSLVYGGARCKN